MSLVVLEDLALHFGAKTLFQGLDLRIAEGDRIGLVGANGSGKTTLMRVLAGQQETDHGGVARARGITVAYLPQDLAVEGGRRLIELVRDSVPGRQALDAEILSVQARLDELRDLDTDADASLAEEALDLAERVAALHERADHFERFFSEHEAARILAGLGFSRADFDRDVGELSGGWKMRGLLAALLFQRPDLLLLDEPTNHLDLPSVAWLGGFLSRASFAFVLISHDREFMDELATRIVSFEPEGVRQYKGNFSRYRAQREEEEIVLAAKAKNLQREREHAEAFIERFRSKASKAKAVQSRVKALERLEPVITVGARATLDFDFPPCARSGNEPIRIEGLAKRFGDHEIFAGVDLSVLRGDRIGIIGVNGAGKTTLLKTIAGELEASAGRVRFGANVDVGYYAQHHADTLARGDTIYQAIAQCDPAAGQTRVRAIAGAFMFPGDDVEKRISVLSGGERSRVALARLLIKPGNVLLMDEPTNHLDLASSEALAESLARFDGTLLFVSHNRSFVRRLATKIWNVEAGRVEVYPGTLDDYLARARGDADPAAPSASPEALRSRGGADGAAGGRQGPRQGTVSVHGRPQSAGHSTTRSAGTEGETVASSAPRSRTDEKQRKRDEAARRTERSRRLGPLQRAVKEFEDAIEKLETERKHTNQQLADVSVYADAKRRDALLSDHHRIAAALEDVTARWEAAVGALEAAERELA